MNSDESPAVVELPDDAIEQALVEGFGQARWDAMNGAEQHDARDLFGPMAVSIAARVRAEAQADAQASGGDLWPPAGSYHWRCAEALLKRARWDEWRSWGLRRQSEEITKLADALAAVIPESDVGRFVAGRVVAGRAEAVAGERQRIASEVEGEFQRRIQARVDQNRADGYPQTADAMLAGAGYLLDVLREWAAGSVPVATPEVHDAGCEVAYGQGSCFCQRRADVDFSHTATGPVATPTEPAHMHNWDGPCSACPPVTPTDAGRGAALIAAERKRQIDVEGWSAEHDDQHGPAVLLDASLCYQAGELNPDPREYRNGYGRAVPLWPWQASWWKPKDRLRNLVRAGALAQAAAEVAGRRVAAIAAEIDGLQAASPVPAEQPSGGRAAFDRRSGEEEAGAELLGHRLTVGGVTPGHSTHVGAGYDCCCGECLYRRRSVPSGQEAEHG